MILYNFKNIILLQKYMLYVHHPELIHNDCPTKSIDSPNKCAPSFSEKNNKLHRHSIYDCGHHRIRNDESGLYDSRIRSPLCLVYATPNGVQRVWKCKKLFPHAWYTSARMRTYDRLTARTLTHDKHMRFRMHAVMAACCECNGDGGDNERRW